MKWHHVSTRISLFLATTALALLLCPLASLAGEPRTHDGLFLRLSAGGGYANSKIEEAGVELIKVSGGAGEYNFAIGGTPGSNLAVHGTLFGWSLSDPTVALIGVDLPSSGTFTMAAFGAGITYYFMPANIYISPNLGLATLSGADDFDGRSETGFAIDLTLGKEWWVGNSWGLGVAGAFNYHNIPEKDSDANWTGTSFALRFTATLN